MTPNYRNYDVTADGESFIMVQPPRNQEQSVIVLLNWFDNLPKPPR